MNKWNYFHEQMELIYIIFMKIYIIFSWRCFLWLCKPWLSYRHALTVDTVHHSEGGPQVRVPSLLELVRLASEPAFWNMETGLSTYLRWTTAEKTPDRWWWWTRQGICDRWVKTNCYIICIDVLFMNAPCPRICTWNIRTTKTNICFFFFHLLQVDKSSICIQMQDN